MRDDKYETLIKEIREISSDIARLDRDLESDRQELANFKVEMATLAEEVRQSRKETSAITKDVGDKVKDTLKPAVKAVDELKQGMEKKRVVTITPNLWGWLKHLSIHANRNI